MFTLTVAVMSGLCYGGPPTTYHVGSLTVEVSEPVVINQSDTQRCWFPVLLTHIGETRLLLLHTMCADSVEAIKSTEEDAKVACVVTEDGGHTWSDPMPHTEFPCPWIQLQDRTFIGVTDYPDYVSPHVACCRVCTSRDGVQFEMSPATVDGSPHTFTRGTSGFCGMIFCRSLIEALDGSLLAHMYGRFEGDVLDRSILVRSTDRGKTWRYYSLIGYDPTVGGEGLNEPCMVRLADRSLFCFMRNESGRPMYRSRSTDDGRTWSKPDRMPDKYASMSVLPDLVLMRSGILAWSAGRPRCQLAFCTDANGSEWTDPITVFDGPSTGYTSIREVAPDTLLYVHDIVPAGWDIPKPGQVHQVVGRFISAKR